MGRMDGNEPATKQDIPDLKQGLRTSIEQLRSDMKHNYRDLLKRLDELATRMITAFNSVAESHGERLTDLDSSDAALLNRLSSVESRVMAIEKRLNISPAA